MLHFIYNPVSGRGKNKVSLAKMTAYCDRKHVPYAIHATEYAGHIKTIISDLEAQGPCDIVVLGGDGTFHEALNGIVDFSKVRLGLIPCGSGNDFVRSGRFHTHSAVRALKTILRGHTKKIDYLQFDSGERCLNVAGTGLDIEVLKVARAQRRVTGKINYVKALFRVIKNFDPYDVSVTVNGETHDYSTILVAMANGKKFGGGIHISPRSKLNDGKAKLVIIKMVDRRRIKFVVPQFIIGAHLGKDFCIYESVDRVEVKSKNPMLIELDGETYSIPFACSIVKEGLTVFVD